MNLKSSDSVSTQSRELIQAAENKPIAWVGYYELTKPRLSLLSVITALVGYLAALPARDLSVLFNFLVGTALCAGGAAVLNQWIEQKEDAIMPRTRNRPIPSGQVSPIAALIYGMALSVVGSAQLFLGVNDLAGWLGVATILSYIAIYTPLKKKTQWATEVGAISGALPPLIGWAAAEGSISGLGWILFAILTFWQIPHFMAIAWTYREDYASAGFPMLSVKDAKGQKVANWSLANAIALFVISILPVFLGFSSWIYGITATLFGLWFLKRAWDFTKPSNREFTARKLFFNSIFYLPAALFSLVLDRWILG